MHLYLASWKAQSVYWKNKRSWEYLERWWPTPASSPATSLLFLSKLQETELISKLEPLTTDSYICVPEVEPLWKFPIFSNPASVRPQISHFRRRVCFKCAIAYWTPRIQRKTQFWRMKLIMRKRGGIGQPPSCFLCCGVFLCTMFSISLLTRPRYLTPFHSLSFSYYNFLMGCVRFFFYALQFRVFLNRSYWFVCFPSPFS